MSDITPVDDSLINMREVEALVGLRRSRIWDLVRAGDFPKQVRIGGCSRYSRNEVLDWIEDRKAERSPGSLRPTRRASASAGVQ